MVFVFTGWSSFAFWEDVSLQHCHSLLTFPGFFPIVDFYFTPCLLLHFGPLLHFHASDVWVLVSNLSLAASYNPHMTSAFHTFMSFHHNIILLTGFSSAQVTNRCMSLSVFKEHLFCLLLLQADHVAVSAVGHFFLTSAPGLSEYCLSYARNC